jgi:hypothetical protein
MARDKAFTQSALLVLSGDQLLDAEMAKQIEQTILDGAGCCGSHLCPRV